MKNKIQPIEDDDELAKLMPAFGDDLDLFLFYLSWLKNGLNATEAYLERHPDVKRTTAQVQGSELLSKVNKGMIMKAYGLDHQRYYKQLDEALNATKWNDFTGEREPDHKTREPYHSKLGKQLGVEKDGNNTINVSGDKVIAILGDVNSE